MINSMSRSKILPGTAKVALTGIGIVERATGLSKDTLRIWERRYGFPRPARDGNGERVYSAEQVEKLRIIRVLMDRGLRPGRIVPETLRELNARLLGAPAADAAAANPEPLEELLRLLEANKLAEMSDYLAQLLLRLGLQRFVVEAVAPLNVLIGNAWMQGRIEIFEEHLYTQQVRHLLHRALAPSSLAQTGLAPRVLLTTLSGEEHELGLLMAQACLTVEGAQCISLGVQTPAWDIARAAGAHDVDVVGLSFSPAMQLRAAREGVIDVRQCLDPGIELWVGGSIWQRAHKAISGVTAVASLAEIPTVLAAWRAAHAARTH